MSDDLTLGNCTKEIVKSYFEKIWHLENSIKDKYFCVMFFC